VLRRSLRLLLRKLFSGEVGANNPFEVIADVAAGGVQQVTNAWDAAVTDGKEVGLLIALTACMVIEIPVKLRGLRRERRGRGGRSACPVRFRRGWTEGESCFGGVKNSFQQK
jgi:hypothetical protein